MTNPLVGSKGHFIASLRSQGAGSGICPRTCPYGPEPGLHRSTPSRNSRVPSKVSLEARVPSKVDSELRAGTLCSTGPLGRHRTSRNMNTRLGSFSIFQKSTGRHRQAVLASFGQFVWRKTWSKDVKGGHLTRRVDETSPSVGAVGPESHGRQRSDWSVAARGWVEKQELTGNNQKQTGTN